MVTPVAPAPALGLGLGAASGSGSALASASQIALGVLLGLLALACVLTVVLLVIAFSLSRLGSDAAPRTRRLLARVALARGGGTLHRGDDRPDPGSVASGLAALTARDPSFDQIAVIEAAHRALFFAFVMQTTGQSKRLEQVTTEEFWRSTLGVGLRTQARAQDQIRAMRERHDAEPAVAAGPVRARGAVINLDFHAGDAVMCSVEPDAGGQDRVTVRLGYVGRSVVTGSMADMQIAAHNKKLWEIALAAGAAGTVGSPHAASDGLAQTEQRGWYDLELVRPVGSSTALGGDGRRCPACGAPFHSDLDTACPNCHQTRVTPEGEWLLARSWLVVS